MSNAFVQHNLKINFGFKFVLESRFQTNRCNIIGLDF